MQEGRQEHISSLLLYLFTAVTGLVDAVRYIGLGHVFTATLASLGYVSVSLDPIRLYAGIVLTALAMGLRNATVRKIAQPDLTTTVLTLTITGLAADSSLAGGSNPRWQRRVMSILFMFTGAVVGALLLRHSLPLPLGLATASAVCGVAAFYGNFRLASDKTPVSPR